MQEGILHETGVQSGYHPQCGFATFAAGKPLSWDEQRRKLERVVQTARRAWGS